MDDGTRQELNAAIDEFLGRDRAPTDLPVPRAPVEVASVLASADLSGDHGPIDADVARDAATPILGARAANRQASFFVEDLPSAAMSSRPDMWSGAQAHARQPWLALHRAGATCISQPYSAAHFRHGPMVGILAR